MNFKGFNSFIGWHLMHRDGILHVKEEAIKQTAIRMGLNPEATKRVKKNGKCAQCNYSGRFIIENFREERN
jgi:hypothetical protein